MFISRDHFMWWSFQAWLKLTLPLIKTNKNMLGVFFFIFYFARNGKEQFASSIRTDNSSKELKGNPQTNSVLEVETLCLKKESTYQPTPPHCSQKSTENARMFAFKAECSCSPFPIGVIHVSQAGVTTHLPTGRPPHLLESRWSQRQTERLG